MLLRLSIHTIFWSLLLLLSATGIWLQPSAVLAAAYFEDGYLGLTQTELHQKLGMPQAVRDRKSELRVFTYYAITDWEKYFRKLVSPENGEDVYTFTRDGIDVRYSFSYTFDPNDESENRTLFVRLVDIEFSPSVPLAKIPSLVPEFHPSEDPASPSFRSNIWVLLFKGPASPQARFIVREATRDKLEWTLAYQFFSLQGLPDPLTTKALVDRVEISTQSIELVKQRQRHTHDPILNPYSREFSQNEIAPQRPQQRRSLSQSMRTSRLHDWFRGSLRGVTESVGHDFAAFSRLGGFGFHHIHRPTFDTYNKTGVASPSMIKTPESQKADHLTLTHVHGDDTGPCPRLASARISD